jgi:CheY-like chemotaxis protein
LLKHEIAVILTDVVMPQLDGFELAAMIREHPRFHQTAIIFVSAVVPTGLDRRRGDQYGAVDYVPVPVVPDLLRAKVRVFVDLFRKTRRLERLNTELARRVAECTAWRPSPAGGASAQPVRPSQPPAAPPVMRRCRILVVDDDPIMLSGTAAMLDDLGHTAIEAASAALAPAAPGGNVVSFTSIRRA